ncbi:MAG TPA: L-seryl-tRNA(Sec) selenium transferase [Casimicrobiaceae bacterium]|nr:L-seryl-tRNA(Sec) selenium transferase [Casimicrobiaceae bacterium]
MPSTSRDPRSVLPSVDRLLRQPAMETLVERYGRTQTIAAIRARLAELRPALTSVDDVPGADTIAAACEARLVAAQRPSMRSVMNLSGTVIHTNLGRSPMPECAVTAVAEAMRSPVNLEFDLQDGARGERDDHVEALLKRLTGAQAALAVNNNAAAVYLVLNTLALAREVPVSRGELVEIGGAFRVPDIMQRAGARLVEVGTTNRTHRHDYEAAIGDATAALMKVHASNYRIEGFTLSVGEAELADVAHSRGLPLVCDLGSGTLVDLTAFGLPHEPTPGEMLDRGVDLVTFSGDKLLGGPQAGLIVGRNDLVDAMRRNPMKRALRLDKMTLAALEAVLRLYDAPDRLRDELPVLRLLTRPLCAIEEQAQRLLPKLRAVVPAPYEVRSVEAKSQIGSGSLPVDLLPSCALRIRLPGGDRGSAAAHVASAFRALPLPVIGRVHDGDFLLDLRCLAQEDEFVAQLNQLRLQTPT